MPRDREDRELRSSPSRGPPRGYLDSLSSSLMNATAGLLVLVASEDNGTLFILVADERDSGTTYPVPAVT
jgi:hypothetical protein